MFTASISELTPAEERQSGYFEAMNKLHQEKVNAVNLARTSDSQFVFAFKNPVNKPDFSGLKIRGLPFSLNLIKQFKWKPDHRCPAGTLQRTGKGRGRWIRLAAAGPHRRKFHEIVKYQIDHPYYTVGVGLLMNLDTWNRLPPHLQKLVLDIMPEVERVAVARHADLVKKEREELIKQGVTFIKWSPEDAKKFYELARKAGREEALRVAPEHRPELIKMITR